MDIDKKIEELVSRKNSLLCVGIDPDVTDANLNKKGYHHGAESLNKCLELIEKTGEHASFFKFNFAFALTAFENPTKDLSLLVKKAKSLDSISIIDFKAGDILNTSKHYARFAFEIIDSDAVTLNPYMGSDVIMPFLEYKDRVSFVLTKTSNSPEIGLQDLKIDDELLYHKSIRMALELNKLNNNAGIVVGATNIEAIKVVRGHEQKPWILIPGVGSQGGELNKVIEAAGSRFSINVSRQIMHSDSPEKTATELKNKINELVHKLS